MGTRDSRYCLGIRASKQCSALNCECSIRIRHYSNGIGNVGIGYGKMENGKWPWQMKNKWQIANGKWIMANGKLANSKWQMANGKWQMTNGKWQMINGKWQMANGKWQMANGKWQMAN